MLRGFITAAAVFACSPAFAQSPFYGCENGCSVFTDQPGVPGTSYMDYTIPDNGQTYKWTIRLDDPEATFSIGAPNQVEIYTYVRTADRFDMLTNGYFEPVFDEIVEQGRTTIFVRAPKSLPYSCDDPGPVGSICMRRYIAWGNGAPIYVRSDRETVHLIAVSAAVPEPASWALMLLGFGGVGLKGRATDQTLSSA